MRFTADPLTVAVALGLLGPLALDGPCRASARRPEVHPAVGIHAEEPVEGARRECETDRARRG